MYKKVLVVDSDPDFVEAMRKKLYAEQYDALWAFDGEEGLEIAKTENPDLIILDIAITKVGCRKFLYELKSDDNTRKIPLMLTGKQRRVLEDFAEEGYDYLVKPITVGELLLKIRGYLGAALGNRVLVISESKDFIKSVETLLMVNKFAMLSAMTRQEAQEKLLNENPELIIFDFVSLPASWNEFIRDLKRNNETADVPTIVLVEREGLKDSYFIFGVDEIIVHPIDQALLISKMKFLMRRKGLVLCNDKITADQIREVFEDRRYSVTIVNTEEEMAGLLNLIIYKVIVAYSPSVKKEMADFLRFVRNSKNRRRPIIIYSNNRVKGLEKENLALVLHLQKKWNKAGADNFFDIRISDNDFPVFIEQYMESSK